MQPILFDFHSREVSVIFVTALLFFIHFLLYIFLLIYVIEASGEHLIKFG